MSISLRLTLWFSFAFMIGFSIFGAVMYVQLSYSLAAGRDNTLEHRAQRAKTLLTTCNHGNVASKFEDFAAGTPEGNLISIFNDEGKWLYPAVLDTRETFPWPTHPPATYREFSKGRHAGNVYRVLSEWVVVDSNRLWIVIGGQLQDNRAILRQFRNGLLWATPLFLALSALFGYLLSSRALRPVAKLISSFRSISAGNLSKRLPIIHSGDELEALTLTCNAMLARLDTAVGQIKRFTADSDEVTEYDRILESLLKERVSARRGNTVEYLHPERSGEENFQRSISIFANDENLSRLDRREGHLQLIQGAVGSGKSLFMERYNRRCSQRPRRKGQSGRPLTS